MTGNDQPGHPPPALAATPIGETAMPSETDPAATAPDWWRAVRAAQRARNRTISDLIAYAEGHMPPRITALEIAARAFEQPPGEAPDSDQ